MDIQCHAILKKEKNKLSKSRKPDIMGIVPSLLFILGFTFVEFVNSFYKTLLKTALVRRL